MNSEHGSLRLKVTSSVCVFQKGWRMCLEEKSVNEQLLWSLSGTGCRFCCDSMWRVSNQPRQKLIINEPLKLAGLVCSVSLCVCERPISETLEEQQAVCSGQQHQCTRQIDLLRVSSCRARAFWTHCCIFTSISASSGSWRRQEELEAAGVHGWEHSNTCHVLWVGTHLLCFHQVNSYNPEKFLLLF